MSSVQQLITALVVISWSCTSYGYIKHCDPKTDSEREQLLMKYPDLKKYLQQDDLVNGRLGKIIFVNWQDQLLSIKAPSGHNCLWKMKSRDNKEEDKFNGKGYSGHELFADPIKTKHYLHVVSCETKDCIQYYNVITRPYPKPLFPVQVYIGDELEVPCTLEHMEGVLKNHQPPFFFEWTGPRDCARGNWNSLNSTKCLRYNHLNAKDGDKCNTTGCTFKIDKTYQVKDGANGSYEDTEVKITTKTLERSKDNNPGEYKSQYEAILRLKKGSENHRGLWRCIVYDRFKVSSDPDADGGKYGHKFLHDQDIIHGGIVHIHVKNLGLAIGIPLAIVGSVSVMVLLCILLCKQCTDFEAAPDDNQIKPPPPKSTDASNSKLGVPSDKSMRSDKKDGGSEAGGHAIHSTPSAEAAGEDHKTNKKKN